MTSMSMLRGDEGATVAFLEEVADGRPTLELAIGTGRIALPLAARGVPVDGVDLSSEMLDRLRAKPGGREITVTNADMADVPVDGTYGVIFVVYNSLFNLLTQGDQVRCFRNVARHLDDDGVFIVEAFVPSFLHQYRDHQHVNAEAIQLKQVRLDVAHHDPVNQRLEESHMVFSPQGIQMFPAVNRYSWPSELDLMAQLAGLHLHHRWGGWNREPFTKDSSNHISVYGRQPPSP